MRTELASRFDLKSRVLALAAQAGDLCALARAEMQSVSLQQGNETHDQLDLLRHTFEQLGHELRASFPYRSASSDLFAYPIWYRPVSTLAGGPREVHQYLSAEDVATWNTYRMAFLRLQTTIAKAGLQESGIALPLSSGEYRGDNKGLHIATAESLALSDATCASIFYSLSSRGDGQPEIQSLEDVPGAKAYALITPLAVTLRCFDELPPSPMASKVRTWIKNVLDIMEQRLGVSEAWCWRDEDESIAKLEIERILSFEG